MPRRDYSKVAFAATGDTATIPGTTQPDGSVSLPQGFGFDYERDNGAGGGTPDPLAKNIEREDMNGILNEITASVGEIQQNGRPIWVLTAAPYPVNAEVRHTDINWKSIVTNNSSEPGTNSDWLNVSAVFNSVPATQCRLSYVSATALVILPRNGNNLVVSGVARAIPSGGIARSNGGANSNTLYYVYAFWNGSALDAELSTTGHSADPVTGVEIKTGDASRTLVGMVYTNDLAQFTDSAQRRLVASWFDRRSVGASVTTSGTINFSATTNTEISSDVRLEFLTWANEAVDVNLTGQYTNNTATQSVGVTSYIDATQYGNISSAYIVSAGAGASYASGNSLTPAGAYLAEGRHTAQVYASVTAGIGSSIRMAHSLVTRI